jgi:hypothetical protein
VVELVGLYECTRSGELRSVGFSGKERKEDNLGKHAIFIENRIPCPQWTCEGISRVEPAQ